MTKYNYFPEKPGAPVSLNGAVITELFQVEEDNSYYLTTELAGYLFHIRVAANKLNRMPHRGDEIHIRQAEVYDHGFRVDGEPYTILYATRSVSRVTLEQP